MRRYKKHPNRINIILDLDNTLISSLSRNEESSVLKPRMQFFNWKNMENYYKVFERPGLQEFLDFLFENFNVSVWTAASKTYALFIINNFILNKPDRHLSYILFSHHCKQSKKIDKTQKSLKMLKNNFKLDEFDLRNTYIIDDNIDVYSAQPTNCINIKPFEFTDRFSYQDNELKNVKAYLENVLKEDINM